MGPNLIRGRWAKQWAWTKGLYMVLCFHGDDTGNSFSDVERPLRAPRQARRAPPNFSNCPSECRIAFGYPLTVIGPLTTSFPNDILSGISHFLFHSLSVPILLREWINPTFLSEPAVSNRVVPEPSTSWQQLKYFVQTDLTPMESMSQLFILLTHLHTFLKNGLPLLNSSINRWMINALAHTNKPR